MANKLWQYQTFAEPVPLQAVTSGGTVDNCVPMPSKKFMYQAKSESPPEREFRLDKYYQLPNQPKMVSKELVRADHSQILTEFVPEYSVSTKVNLYFPTRNIRIIGESAVQPLVQTEQETVTLDKLLRSLDNPILPPRLRLEQSVVDPYQLTQTERITLDKYWQKPNEPVRSGIQLVREGFNVTALNTFIIQYPVGVDSSIYLAIKELPPMDYTVATYSQQDVTSFPDRWFKETETPPKGHAKRPHGWFTVDTSQLTQTERITLDKYWRQLSEPLRFGPRLVREGLSVNDAKEFRVDLDRYWRQLVEPVRNRPQLVREGTSVFDAKEFRVNLDQYWQQQNEPLRFRPQLVREGLSVFDPREFRVPMDRWFRETERPPKGLIPKVPIGWFVNDPFQLLQVETITLDKYWQLQNEPRRFRPQLVREGLSIFDPREFRVNLDQYWKQLSEPLRIRPQLIREGAASFDPYFRLDPDRWATQTATPSLRVVSVGDSGLVFPIITADVTAFVDRWIRDTDTPPKGPAKRPDGWFAIDPIQLTQAETSTIDKYWQQPNVPRWIRVPLVPEGIFSDMPGSFIIKYPVGVDSNIYIVLKELPLIDHTVSPFRFEDTSAFTDRWFRETETPPKTAAPRLAGWSTIDPSQLTQAEQSTIDKWFKDNNQIFRTNTFRDVVSSTVLRQEEAVTLDKWFKDLEKPYLRVRELVKEGVPGSDPTGYIVEFSVGSEDAVCLVFRELPDLDYTVLPPRQFDTSQFTDRWFKETETPPKKAAPRQAGWFSIDPRQLTQAEQSTIDKWFKDNNLVFGKSIFRDMSGVSPFRVELVTLDKWFKELEKPSQKKLSALPEGLAFRFTPSGEIITLDKWFKQLEKPELKKLSALPEGLAFRFTPAGEVITLDKWFRELEKPQARKKNPLLDGLAFKFTPGEEITLDKWFKDNFIPTLLGQKNQRELSHISFANRETIFDLSVWLPPFVSMVRSKQFRAELFDELAKMQFDTPLVDLDWLVQTNEPIFTRLVKAWLLQYIQLVGSQTDFIVRTMCLNSVAVILAMIINEAEVQAAAVTNTAEVKPATVVNAVDVVEAVVTNTADVIPAVVTETANVVKAVGTDVDVAACKDNV